MNDQFIIPEMWEMFKRHNPDYLGSRDLDFPPLRLILDFLMEKAGEKNYFLARTKIMQLWEAVCQYVAEDSFYRHKALKTIASYIQEITLKTLQGGKSKSGKINKSGIAAAVNKRYPKR